MANLLAIRHLASSQIEDFVDSSRHFKSLVTSGKPVPRVENKVLGLLFFENSTRTRISFEQAANLLGIRTSTFSAGASSMAKGETLKDTILTLKSERLNGLVVRHSAAGAPSMAASIFGGPVVNAGDGQHEHPTQALGDALTITEKKGKSLKGLRVAIVGDVAHSRVARSNAWLLSKLGAEIRFVGPKTLMPNNLSMLPGTAYFDLATGIEEADVVMCLRLQRERMNEGNLSSLAEYASMYQINRETLRWAAKDAIIMHPGPMNRGIEIDDYAADCDRSVICDQVENGIFARMSALHWAFTSEVQA